MIIELCFHMILDILSFLQSIAFKTDNHILADQVLIIQDAMREAGRF